VTGPGGRMLESHHAGRGGEAQTGNPFKEVAMSSMSRLLVLAVALVAMACVAGNALAAELWTDNFEQAKAQAKKEGKDLLLDFTGSDWCPWCVKLRTEVFEAEKFKAEAPKKFVLVELDFPHDKKLSEEVQKQNKDLQQKYNIPGFPTILLMDADGQVYGRTGYKPGGEEKYMAHLDELQKSKDEFKTLLAAADKATGIERAKMLDKALKMMGKNGISPMDNRPLIDEIIKLDDKNEAGLRNKYEKNIRLQDAVKLARANNFDEAIKTVEKAIEDLKLTAEDKQDALFLKAQFIYGKSQDKKAAVDVLKQAVEAAPQSKRVESISAAIKALSQEKPTDTAPKAPATTPAPEPAAKAGQ
jgi:thioredoxin-related protein